MGRHIEMTEPSQHVDQSNGENPHVRHEGSDINFGVVLMFGLGLAGATPLILLMVWLLFGYLTAREGRPVPPEFPLAAQQQERLPPEPRLQTNPRQDLDDMRAEEDRALATYGWIDRDAGVVRLPIEEAMKLVVERGLGVRQERSVGARQEQ
jgi:hypothetical protein